MRHFNNSRLCVRNFRYFVTQLISCESKLSNMNNVNTLKTQKLSGTLAAQRMSSLMRLHLQMLPQSWEPVATELTQCPDDQVAGIIQRILEENNCLNNDGKASLALKMVFIGYDTRPSAPALLEAAKAGVAAMGLMVDDAGEG